MNDRPAVSLSFRSDNVATVAPEILRALDPANHGAGRWFDAVQACGNDAHEMTPAEEVRIATIFEGVFGALRAYSQRGVCIGHSFVDA